MYIAEIQENIITRPGSVWRNHSTKTKKHPLFSPNGIEYSTHEKISTGKPTVKKARRDMLQVIKE